LMSSTASQCLSTAFPTPSFTENNTSNLLNMGGHCVMSDDETHVQVFSRLPLHPHIFSDLCLYCISNLFSIRLLRK
jgi:hypothetical protein